MRRARYGILQPLTRAGKMPVFLSNALSTEECLHQPRKGLLQAATKLRQANLPLHSTVESAAGEHGLAQRTRLHKQMREPPTVILILVWLAKHRRLDL